MKLTARKIMMTRMVTREEPLGKQNLNTPSKVEASLPKAEKKKKERLLEAEKIF